MEIVPFSINQHPAGLHTTFWIEVEPAAVVFVAQPAGLDITVLVERPPVSVDMLPRIGDAVYAASGTGEKSSKMTK